MKNYAVAQFAIAEINVNGEGVRVNPVEAYFWATLATKNKLKSAKSLLEKLEVELSEEDKQAQIKRAEKWLAKYK